MVLDSNSDSDSDVLEEFDFGITNPRPQKQTNSGPETLEKSHSTRALRSSLKINDNGLRLPSSKKQVTKTSLSGLVQKALKDAEAEQRIAAGKADLEKPVEEGTQQGSGITEEALAGVVEENEDGTKAKKLYAAMQRTNAQDTECVFHFFGEDLGAKPRASPFPAKSLPEHGWVANFKGLYELADLTLNSLTCFRSMA